MLSNGDDLADLDDSAQEVLEPGGSRYRSPCRIDLLRALVAAERMLRQQGANWEQIPGFERRPMLRLAHRLDRLLKKCKLPPPALRKRDMIRARAG